MNGGKTTVQRPQAKTTPITPSLDWHTLDPGKSRAMNSFPKLLYTVDSDPSKWRRVKEISIEQVGDPAELGGCDLKRERSLNTFIRGIGILGCNESC